MRWVIRTEVGAEAGPASKVITWPRCRWAAWRGVRVLSMTTSPGLRAGVIDPLRITTKVWPKTRGTPRSLVRETTARKIAPTRTTTRSPPRSDPRATRAARQTAPACSPLERVAGEAFSSPSPTAADMDTRRPLRLEYRVERTAPGDQGVGLKSQARAGILPVAVGRRPQLGCDKFVSRARLTGYILGPLAISPGASGANRGRDASSARHPVPGAARRSRCAPPRGRTPCRRARSRAPIRTRRRRPPGTDWAGILAAGAGRPARGRPGGSRRAPGRLPAGRTGSGPRPRTPRGAWGRPRSPGARAACAGALGSPPGTRLVGRLAWGGRIR